MHHADIWNSNYINFDILIIVIYILWIVYEATLSRNDVTREMVVSDSGTRELYAISQALTILSALWFTPVWRSSGIYHLIGCIVFISGISFRIWAIQTLGQYYSHVVRKIHGHRIIDSGPYAVLRHPAYTGMITAHIGITIFYFNYATLAILLLLLIPSIIVRILVEEKTLIGIPGYVEFSRTRKRIIPHVW